MESIMNNGTYQMEDDLHEGTTAIVLYVCLGIFGVIGNGFAIFILSTSNSMRNKVITGYLINQSAIDLTASFFLMTFGFNKEEATIVSFSGKWADLYCKFVGSRMLLWGVSISSTWNLVFINFERFLSVVFPIFHKTSVKKSYAMFSFIFVWLCGPLYEFVMNYKTSGLRNGQCITAGIWPTDTIALVGGLIYFTFQFLIPLLIMILCYAVMFKTLRAKVDISSQVTQENKKSSRNKSILKILILVTGIFIICWLPNSFLFLLFNVGAIGSLSGNLWTFSVYLAFLNSCMNPIVYAAQYKDFQVQVMKIFHKGI